MKESLINIIPHLNEQESLEVLFWIRKFKANKYSYFLDYAHIKLLVKNIEKLIIE